MQFIIYLNQGQYYEYNDQLATKFIGLSFYNTTTKGDIRDVAKILSCEII